MGKFSSQTCVQQKSTPKTKSAPFGQRNTGLPLISDGKTENDVFTLILEKMRDLLKILLVPAVFAAFFVTLSPLLGYLTR